ncbi:MAG TPA: hypothetical protein VG936_12480 [Lacunisphaera sp.]|nr:hypothetical protein [Lacunisphaera sp.]
MSAPHWQFNDRRRKDPIRDPIQGEFFANEAIKNPEEALVREGIQNSLDAAARSGRIDPVKIRIHLASGESAASASAVGEFMLDAWDHLHAKGNGIKHPPAKNAACPFLAFEDFGTCGLNGDVSASEEETGNLFFYFFRAEGRSEKLGEKRGRWGVGKHVFPSASQINSFFGFTVRSEDKKQYLMGRSVLKCHSIGSDGYMPDGFFGIPDQDGFMTPTNDDKVIDRFRRTFQIARTSEPGLSIVMPWVNPEFTERQLVSAVLRGYFYPILEGALEVTVETAEGRTIINESTITELSLSHLDKGDEDLRPMLRLGAWAAFAKSGEFTILNPAEPMRPVWIPELVPADKLDALRTRFDAGERIAIRAPLTVRFKEKGKNPQTSHLDFFLIRDGYESGKTIFLREGIIISGVKAPLVRGVRSLVVASDGAIATLLGDAENPSHTEWLTASAHFAEKYYHGRSYLDFVIRCVYEFVKILTASDKKGDPLLLLSLFAIPSKSEEGAARPGAKKKPDGNETPNKIDIPQPKPKPFKVERVKGGFCVSRSDGELQVPATLIIQAAYDVRRGSPLGKYRPADFTLVRPPINVESHAGVKIREGQPNQLLVDVVDPNFRLALNGFDTRRDLFVKVDLQSVED